MLPVAPEALTNFGFLTDADTREDEQVQ